MSAPNPPAADAIAAAHEELRHARAHSEALVAVLDPDQIMWRPHDDSSAIGWHLGHQAAVAHYLVRNLTAAEPEIDPVLDRLFDSATPEPARGALPPLDELVDFRRRANASVDATMARIARREVGAPDQLAIVEIALLRVATNHEYQHAAWIAEVRSRFTNEPVPRPGSSNLIDVDGYWMVAESAVARRDGAVS